MRLFLVRHAESEANAQRFSNKPTTPLSPLGKEQAARLADRLRDERIAVIYTSPLTRAIETTNAIRAYHPDALVHIAPELTERQKGIFAGKPLDAFTHAITASGVSPFLYRPPGGESVADIVPRVQPFLEKVEELHKGRTVLFVTHKKTMEALLKSLLSISWEDISRTDLANASISIFHICDSPQHVAECVGDVSHL